ncbi:hypothetical protein [Rathayibacter tanaceti]|uniref:Secreted protein n=2 Tax=Rathayibacter tanaceti TaxID=1671680 RepID=A0A166I147_9MICO|nr:hypothetical protein [Rathayibacter tanaceti]KZX21465.1 hypothetical protein ACH61_01426 [Rathayibacter tanaceti]QHC54364.1 hypothetical protein GSU10_00920 [Rathayibacter tanaceti]TCO38047.1 hypothetical protein EV639_103234 [Rathayibacter tanaceti]
MSTTTTTTSRARRYAAKVAVLLTVPLLIGSLAACTSGTPGSAEQSPTSAGSFNDWQVDYASCMRGEGVDMPDPASDGGTAAIGVDEAGSEVFQTASETCMARLGEPPAPDGETSVADEFEGQLTTAECLRANGVDVDDPVKGEAMEFPLDIPEDVLDTCGLSAGAGSGSSTGSAR